MLNAHGVSCKHKVTILQFPISPLHFIRREPDPEL